MTAQPAMAIDYDQYWEPGRKIDFTGIACQEFAKNFIDERGGDSPLQHFRKKKLFQTLQSSSDFSVTCCILNPYADFVKTRIREEGNPRCRLHIRQTIDAIRGLNDDLSKTPETIKGSMTVYISLENRYPSLFRVADPKEQRIFAGFLVHGRAGSTIDKIEIRPDNNWPLFKVLGDHIDKLTGRPQTHKLFEWNREPRPLYRPNYPREYNYDVFLCYNREDEVVVNKIAADLQDLGKLPWVDTEVLPFQPGDASFEVEIDKAIRRTPIAAICFGPKGVGGWQTEEIRMLRQHKSLFLVPVLLPGQANFPKDEGLTPLSEIHRIDFNRGWTQAIKELNHRIDLANLYV